jgi:hypothetical protein
LLSDIGARHGHEVNDVLTSWENPEGQLGVC